MAQHRLLQFLSWWQQPGPLIGVLAFLACAIAAMLYAAVFTFDAIDLMPNINEYTEQQRAEAVPVNVGLVLAHVPKFDMTNDSFIFDMVIWFEFDESKIPLEMIKKITFQRGSIMEQTEPVVTRTTEHTTLAHYRIRLAFSTPLDQSRFPLSDHYLYITLANEYISASSMRFVSDNDSFIIEPDVDMGVWRAVGHSVATGYFKDTLRKKPLTLLEQPGAIFTINLVKKSIQSVLLIIFPMFILFALALLTFILEPTNGAILFLATGSLTGLTAYRFVIQSVVPNVGYFTVTDHIFNLFLLAILLITTIDIFVVNAGQDTLHIRALKGASVISLLFIILISFGLLLL